MSEYQNVSREQLIESLKRMREYASQLEINGAYTEGMGNALPDMILIISENGEVYDIVTGEKYLLIDDTQGKTVKNISDILPVEVSLQIIDSIRAVIEMETIQIFDFSLNKLEGKRWFEGHISLLPHMETYPEAIVMIARDITKRKEIEEKLHASEERYRGIFNEARDGIVLVDVNTGMITECNPEFEKQTGRTQEQLKEMKIWDLRPPDKIQAAFNKFKEITEKGVGESGELEFSKPDGTIVNIEFLSKKVTIEGKDCLQSITRDISIRRQMEENLRFSDTTLKSIHDAVYAMDTDFRITYWNKACEDIFGIQENDAIGRYVRDILTMKEDYPGQNQERTNLVSEKGFNQEEIILITPKGDVWADVHTQAIEQDGIRYGWVTLACDITERKKVEEELKLSEERMSKAFRSVPDSIVISRREDGKYIDVNDSFVRFSGYPREELMTNTALGIGIWVDSRERLKALSLLEKKGRVENFEFEFRRRSGETGSALLTIEPITINEEACILSVTTDITERKRVEETLKEPAENYRSLFNNASIGIVVLQDDQIVLINPSMCEICGYTVEEAKELDFFSILHPEDREIVAKRKNDRLKGIPVGDPIDSRLITKSGDVRWIRTRSVKIRWNRKPAIQAFVIDITEEKKAEEALRESEENYRSLVDNASIGIVVIQDKKLVLVNPHLLEKFGYTEEETEELEFLTTLYPEDREVIIERIEERLAGTPPGDPINVRMVTKSGDMLWVRTRSVKIQWNGKPAVQAFVLDITEEKTAQEELKHLYENERFLRQEIETEMNKRIELAAGIVHELKTPLTAIISSSELITENTSDGILGRIAQNISQSAYDLDKRTGELLDMARGDIGMLKIEKTTLSYQKLIKSMELELLTYLARKGISLSISVEQDLPDIVADEERLRQVILNLIDNAFKFTHESGSVFIEVKREDTNIITEVRDNGIGLSEEDQKYVFQPYSQITGSNRPAGGLGLGLALARNLVEAHDGKMWVQSERGKGSSFFFSLPVQIVNEGEQDSDA
ncbi:MAG: PAS domain S-box protein [Dehalococcoidales bacterium]|nr:MAG: PAS domain S-box protein [Dehalococcoidales bacterium]